MATEFYNKGESPDYNIRETLREMGYTPSYGISTEELVARAITNTYHTASRAREPIATSVTLKADKLASFNSQAAPYTLQASDLDKIVRITATGTVTLPDGLDEGFACIIVNASAGVVALSATTTLNTDGGFTSIANQYQSVYVIHVGSNVWEAYGTLS